MVGAVLVEGVFSPHFFFHLFGSGLCVACAKMLGTIPTLLLFYVFGAGGGPPRSNRFLDSVDEQFDAAQCFSCLLYTSPSPRD